MERAKCEIGGVRDNFQSWTAGNLGFAAPVCVVEKDSWTNTTDVMVLTEVKESTCV
jgi:hypothetical protein